MQIKTVGSVCSGIEAASVAWEPLGMSFQWFSEIADFPSEVLNIKYPLVRNIGDMVSIPELIYSGELEAPDMICGGTPCQAFSLAGWKNGLNDERGNLTLRFVDIVDANDSIRQKKNKKPAIVFWENVEGVLTDKTNAFGCLVSSLAGLDVPIEKKKWPNAGAVHGKKRNVAWRVLDAKFFGVPQQRRRLYLLAGGLDFFPENVLFEMYKKRDVHYPATKLTFEKDGHSFEVFREYTDCLYSAYGTKWNGNAAAYNGSLFVVQDGRIRRLSPLECERLMGFPDDYTSIPNAKRTQRYQAIGNSWVVPVVKWIGERLVGTPETVSILNDQMDEQLYSQYNYYDLSDNRVWTKSGRINTSSIPNECVFGEMKSIVSPIVSEKLYLSPVGCFGIIRRKEERNLKINPRLEEILLDTSKKMTPEEIEKRSRIQKRGRLSSSDSTKEVYDAFVNPDTKSRDDSVFDKNTDLEQLSFESM